MLDLWKIQNIKNFKLNCNTKEFLFNHDDFLFEHLSNKQHFLDFGWKFHIL